MTIFDLVNACILPWFVVRIFTEGNEGEAKDLGSFFKFEEIPEPLLESKVDTWSASFYDDRGEEICEISIII